MVKRHHLGVNQSRMAEGEIPSGSRSVGVKRLTMRVRLLFTGIGRKMLEASQPGKISFIFFTSNY